MEMLVTSAIIYYPGSLLEQSQIYKILVYKICHGLRIHISWV